MTRIHVLQHVPFETLGSIENWIVKKEHQLTFTRFYQGDRLPPLASFDWLIILGGPMSVNDEDKFNWLAEEKSFIKSAVDANKIVLGICLGAQLIASILGSAVYRNKEKEIGWHPISTTIYAMDHDIFSSLPRALKVFHWHSDTFDLPENSTLLAESNACQNQLFIWNEKVIGMQFHLEITEVLVKAMIENGRNEITKQAYVQEEDAMTGRTDLINESMILMENILDNLEEKFASDI